MEIFWGTMQQIQILDKYNPLNLIGMNLAIQRVVQAINHREKVVIFGLSDLDGITGISLLLLVLRYLNADVEYFIPDNICDKAELSADNINDYIKPLGAKLIITVGCGMNSYDQAELCSNSGIDFIITDNHEPDSEYDGVIDVNPKQEGCQYPFKDLSASAIAFKLAQGIAMYYKMKCVNKYLDLVLLGTLSSGVPLIDENLRLIEAGIKKFAITNNYGIKALLKVNNIHNININNIYKLAKSIIPQKGALCQVDNARIAVELFTTSDLDRAEQISKYLNKEMEKTIHYINN